MCKGCKHRKPVQAQPSPKREARAEELPLVVFAKPRPGDAKRTAVRRTRKQ